MNRGLVSRLGLVRRPRSRNRIHGVRYALQSALRLQRRLFPICSHFKVKQVVGPDTEHPFRWSALGSLGLVLKHDAGNVDGSRVEFGGRGDRVVARLETRNPTDDHVERNAPHRSVLSSRPDVQIVTRSELKDFSKFEAPSSDDRRVLCLVARKVSERSTSFGRRRKLGEQAQSLTTRNSRNVDIMTEHSLVRRRNGERNLGQLRIERLDIDDSRAALRRSKSERIEQPVDLDVRVGRPESDVVAVLVRDTRTLDVELGVYAVTLATDAEQLLDSLDRRGVRILRIVNATCFRQCTRRKFTYKYVSSIPRGKLAKTHRDKSFRGDGSRPP